MEVLFLLVGLVFIALAAAIIVSDLSGGCGTESVPAKVIGFSNGRKNRINGHSFYSVAEYVGPDGRTTSRDPSAHPFRSMLLEMW